MSKRPTPEKFIETWQTSSSLQEVAKKLGMREKTASQRAVDYRKRGVPLKKMSRTTKRRLDWQKLAELARQFENKEDTT